MEERDRLCCLTLDEMEIKTAVEYDVSSKQVLGKVTLPGHSGTANHALVVMLGGTLISSFSICDLLFYCIA